MDDKKIKKAEIAEKIKRIEEMDKILDKSADIFKKFFRL